MESKDYSYVHEKKELQNIYTKFWNKLMKWKLTTSNVHETEKNGKNLSLIFNEQRAIICQEFFMIMSCVSINKKKDDNVQIYCLMYAWIFRKIATWQNPSNIEVYQLEILI